MTEAPTISHTDLAMRPFKSDDAVEIARWVTTVDELHWLAPSTPHPLTAEKVERWRQPKGNAFVLARGDDPAPVAYAELNPMRAQPNHLWVGHAIVRPAERGKGVGQTLVRGLIDQAFHKGTANQISLVVFPSNTAAIACYCHAGFSIVNEEFYRFGGAGRKHRLMRLEIRKPSE